MKKVRIILTAAAFVAGIGGAFATKIVNNGTAWFHVTLSGNPTGIALPAPDCDEQSQQLCAKEYTVDDSNNPIAPTGNEAFGNRE